VANDDHVAQLMKGVDNWNAWREENPDIRLDLSGADFSRANLGGVNFGRSRPYSKAPDLRNARFIDANLSKAALDGADLSGADLSGADLSKADLGGADLSGANLGEINLEEANVTPAQMNRMGVSRMYGKLSASRRSRQWPCFIRLSSCALLHR
jgi:uncharacterized protein YjbI with pentapeptide repeats